MGGRKRCCTSSAAITAAARPRLLAFFSTRTATYTEQQVGATCLRAMFSGSSLPVGRGATGLSGPCMGLRAHRTEQPQEPGWFLISTATFTAQRRWAAQGRYATVGAALCLRSLLKEAAPRGPPVLAVFPPHVTIQSPKCKIRCRRSDKYLQLSADCKNIVNSSSAMLTGREVAGKLVQY